MNKQVDAILDKVGAEHKTIFVVDWDGVCAEAIWPEWGNWLPGAVDGLRELLKHGVVKISSARINPHEIGDDTKLRDPKEVKADIRYMRAMLDDQSLHNVVIHTVIGKPTGTYYIDDRAIEFKGSWAEVLSRVSGTSTNTLSADTAVRKATPVTTGVLDYFPAAIAEIAKVSKAGNDKHNPGEKLHWARGKSTDQADAIGRHLLDRGGIDPETGQRHSAELAWRALAMLQLELEEAGAPLARGARVD